MKLYVLCIFATLACVSGMPAPQSGPLETMFNMGAMFPEMMLNQVKGFTGNIPIASMGPAIGQQMIDAGRTMASSVDKSLAGLTGGSASSTGTASAGSGSGSVSGSASGSSNPLAALNAFNPLNFLSGASGQNGAASNPLSALNSLNPMNFLSGATGQNGASGTD